MERLRKVLSIFAAAALLAPAGGALAGRPVFHHHHADQDGEEKDHASDRGGKPAEGKAGDLTLRSRALLGKDGITQIEVSTGAFDKSAPGQINHVHIRAVDPDRRGDRNEDKDDDKDAKFRFRKPPDVKANGYVSYTYPGLPHGLNLRIEAEARGSIHRDEVEAKWLDVVRYRPDLYVSMIDAPDQARINTLVLIDGVVTEHMGEVGAHADIALFVDGNQVDQCVADWIDAGKAHTCKLQHTFTTAGQHTLTVRAQNVSPGDYDDTNNSLPRTITITQPFFAHYGASASEETNVNNTTTDTYLSASSSLPDKHDVLNVTAVTQKRSFTGTLPQGANPTVMRVKFEDSSGGQKLSSFDIDNVELGSPNPTMNPGCPVARMVTLRDDPTGRTLFAGQCSDPTTATASTMVSISWDATQTTSFSEKLCRTSGLCTVGDFLTNSVSTTAATPFGTDYSASVTLDDKGGNVFTGKPSFTLTPYVTLPPTTIKTPCSPFNGRGKRCKETFTNIYGKRGEGSADNAQ
jgi:hypothetical protein